VAINPQDYTYARHGLDEQYQAGPPVPQLMVGTSITAGAGSPEMPPHNFCYFLGPALHAYVGADGLTDNAWTPDNCGVGASTSATSANYLADNFNATTGKIESGASNYLAMKMTWGEILRNEQSNLTLQQSSGFVRLVMWQAYKKGGHFALITPPPQVSVADGSVQDDIVNSYSQYANRAITSAADLGASVADFHRWNVDRIASGIDIRPEMENPTGLTILTHPGNTGYSNMANFGFLCATGPSSPNPPRLSDLPERYPDIITNYQCAGSGSVTATSPISGLTTATTGRIKQTGESGCEVYVLTPGMNASVSFQFDTISYGFIVHTVLGSGGTFRVTYNSLNIDGGGFTEVSSYVREHTYVLDLLPAYASEVGPAGELRITCTSGTIRVLGASSLGPSQISCFPIPAYYAAGAHWTESTFYDLTPCLEGTTEDETITIPFDGPWFAFYRETGTTFGQIACSVDEGAYGAAIDCYESAWPYHHRQTIVNPGTEGRHWVTIKVVEKNPASSGNTVHLSDFRTYTNTFSTRRVIFPKAGVPLDLRAKFNEARILEVYSGAPNIDGALSGNIFTLQGTGYAAVELSV